MFLLEKSSNKQPLCHQHRMRCWIFLSVGLGAQLLALFSAQKHDFTWRFQYHFISRARRRLRANKLSLTGLCWAIGCKTMHFGLPHVSAGGKGTHFSNDGVLGHGMRVGAARLDGRSWHAIGAFHLVPFINYSNLFPLSVSNTGQPSAAVVFLKAFFYRHTLAPAQSRMYFRKSIYIIFICPSFVWSFIDKIK